MITSDVLVDLGMADVDNCFHRIRITDSLGQYFTFLGFFSARELELVGNMLCGSPLASELQVRIHVASLPMYSD